MTSTCRGYIYTTIGLGASHTGLPRQAGAKSLPGLHPQARACGRVVRTTDSNSDRRCWKLNVKAPVDPQNDWLSLIHNDWLWLIHVVGYRLIRKACLELYLTESKTLSLNVN